MCFLCFFGLWAAGLYVARNGFVVGEWYVVDLEVTAVQAAVCEYVVDAEGEIDALVGCTEA